MGDELIDRAMTGLLGQRSGNWGDIIILVVVVAASIFGSVGKWIAKRINEKRELESLRRRSTESLMRRQPSGSPAETARPLPSRFGQSESQPPPIASPVPPTPRRTVQGSPTIPGEASNIDRVFEAILEKATGVKIERPTRPFQTPPTPPPPVRPSPQVVARKQRKKTTPQPGKRTSIAERERRHAAQLAKRQTGAEHETAVAIEREQRFTRGTNLRLGHVETHIEAFSRDEAPIDSIESDLLDRVSLRDAIVLSEILAPPLAIREISSPYF